MTDYPHIESDEVVFPQMQGYRMACCDCGLVHEMDFTVVRVLGENPDGTTRTKPVEVGKYRITMVARRHAKDTAKMRRRINRSGK